MPVEMQVSRDRSRRRFYATNNREMTTFEAGGGNFARDLILADSGESERPTDYAGSHACLQDDATGGGAMLSFGQTFSLRHTC
jgi:hypothetical protein